jgi:peptide/nickel transport system permease protein
MAKYIVRRTGKALIVFFLASLFIFLLIRVVPGEPVVLLADGTVEVRTPGRSSISTGEKLTPAEMERLREELGLNDPYPIRYLKWMGGVFRGHLGTSIFYREDVSSLVGRRLPFTLGISLVILVLSGLFSLLLAALIRRKLKRRVLEAVNLPADIIIGIPVFFISVMTFYLFYRISNYTAASITWRYVVVVFPAVITLAIMVSAFILKYVYFDFLRPQHKAGGGEAATREETYGQALKAGVLPLLKRSVLIVNVILSGMVLVEVILAVPGVFRLLVTSLFALDYIVIESVALVIAGIFIAFNLAMDIVNRWLEPKLASYAIG